MQHNTFNRSFKKNKTMQHNTFNRTFKKKKMQHNTFNKSFKKNKCNFLQNAKCIFTEANEGVIPSTKTFKKTGKKKREKGRGWGADFLHGMRLEGCSKTLQCFTEKKEKRRWRGRERERGGGDKR